MKLPAAICSLLLAVLLGSAVSAFSQIYFNDYRPDVDRMVLETPHFRVIFPVGQDSAAYFAARILEDQYPMVQSLVGGSLRRFPVVLNDHNDWSNGFVSTAHFRSEIEVPPIRGNSQNPRTGGWMENVAPHELVHALHFSNIPSASLPALVRLAGPDLARSFHGAAPAGMTEGIAVYHESNVVYGEGGRGNYPLFLNRGFANLDSPDSWSLAQHLYPTRFTLPAGRHYYGGYQFINWVQREYGPEATRKSIEFFVRYPFLGYGTALRHATGKWPASLFRDYLEEQQEVIDERKEELEEFGNVTNRVINPGLKAAEYHRPFWKDEKNLIMAVGTSHGVRPGLYAYDIESGEMRKVYESRFVENYIWNFDSETGRLTYSRYHQHPWYSNGFVSDLHELDLKTGEKRRLTNDARIHSPAKSGDELYGLVTYRETSQWAQVTENGTVEIIENIYPDTFVSITADPTCSGRFAVIANRNGVQGLWLVEDGRSEQVKSRNPDISFREGSIHDVAWSNDGSRLVVSADPGDIVNIFEYDIEQETLTQLTNSRYNAFNPSYDPEAGRIAFIMQHGNERLPAVLHREEFHGRTWHRADWSPDRKEKMERGRLADYLGEESENWNLRPYRTGYNWLRPRYVVQFAEESGLHTGTRLGVFFESSDVLHRHVYRASVSTSNDRVWGEMYYRNSIFYPGYELEAYYRPQESSTGLVIERGVSVHLPYRYRTEWNTRSSWITFRPGFRLRQLRLDRNTVDPHIRDRINPDWITDPSVRVFIAYNHRLQQNIRDIQPNTGTVIYAQLERYIGSDRDSDPSGTRFGITQYLSPWLSGNHGLMLSAEVITQTRLRVFGTGGLVYRGFGENVLAGLNNAASVRARYVFPLAYIDDGFITVPVYFDRLYMAFVSNTVANLGRADFFDNFPEHTRTVFGAELRADVRFFNLFVNIGIGVGYEPTRNRFEIFGAGGTINF